MNVQTVNFQGLFFINVTKPTDFEMKFLRNTYDFDTLNLEDYLHRIQIPKIENHKKYDLLVLRFPIFSDSISEHSSQSGKILSPINFKLKKGRIVSGYVNFFMSKDQVVVLHEGVLPQIDKIFCLCQKTLHNRTEYMGKGAVFLVYKIIDALIDDCFPVINDITATIDRIDKELEVKQSATTLEEVSITRRNLVVFHTMIKPLVPLFKELKAGKHVTLNGIMQPYWSNLLDHLQKIWDRVEDNRELIEGISESNESFVATETSMTIKVLTVITVILLPLQVFTGFYGMNIDHLPFAQGPFSFEILVGLMLLIAIPLFTIFKLKRWI